MIDFPEILRRDTQKVLLAAMSWFFSSGVTIRAKNGHLLQSEEKLYKALQSYWDLREEETK